MENLLINSDNIKGLNYLLNDKNLKGKIDLIYIDPPFATGGSFTITDGRATTISNSKSGKIAYSDKLKGTEFIEFLRERLLLLKELLSEEGSIYLHIDYKIGHYVKIMMDEQWTRCDPDLAILIYTLFFVVKIMSRILQRQLFVLDHCLVTDYPGCRLL